MAKKLVLSGGKSLLFMLATLSSLLSVTGVGVYGAYTWLRGPIWLRNQFMGLWLSVALFIYSLQTMYTLLKRPRYLATDCCCCCFFMLDFAQFLLAFGGAVLIGICNGLLMRLDSVGWSVAVACVCFVNCLVLVSRRAKAKRAHNRQSYLLATTTSTEPISGLSTALSRATSSTDGFGIWLLRLLSVALKLLALALIGLLANGAVLNGIGTLR
jgi:hypothetical protein